MIVPAGAVVRRRVGLDQMGDHLAVGGAGDAEVAIEEKIAQAAGKKLRVFWLYMRELYSGANAHGELPMLRCSIKTPKTAALKSLTQHFAAREMGRLRLS